MQEKTSKKDVQEAGNSEYEKRQSLSICWPPEMTCRGLTEYLGEEPIPRRKANKHGTFVQLSDLLINPKEHMEKRKKYWNRPYFHGLVKIFNEWSGLHHTLWNGFILRVSMLFEYYCPCLPGSTV